MIYVSPVPINEEMGQYYTKLLGLKPAIDSGNVDDQGELNDRYKIIVPESIKSFPVSIYDSLFMPQKMNCLTVHTVLCHDASLLSIAINHVCTVIKFMSKMTKF